MEKRVIRRPLVDRFTKYGDRFERIGHNPANGMYCYGRTTPEGSVYFEVFRAPIATGEDGSRYERYPWSAEFGFGRALCIRGDEEQSIDKVRFYLKNGFKAGRYPGNVPENA